MAASRVGEVEYDVIVALRVRARSAEEAANEVREPLRALDGYAGGGYLCDEWKIETVRRVDS